MAAWKSRIVHLGLALVAVWPLVHMTLVRRFDVSPWKLAGWGMYATPRFDLLGMEIYGHVAATGSVRVTEQMAIERYSHVMHIVSNVEGNLPPGTTSFDVLAASFPAGTVSGAPKVRAMQIIDELEPSARGVYAGAVGYISFQDDMDLAIAIRTAVVRDGMLYVQAGAGIVHDSVPETEWQETLNKARAVLRAAEIVQLGLDTD